jgi:hypothetical protein
MQQFSSWPNPVAQTCELKCLQIAKFTAPVCVRSHKQKQVKSSRNLAPLNTTTRLRRHDLLGGLIHEYEAA